MKKIKTLITAIASLVPCVMVPLSIASCNNPAKIVVVIEPTAEEKILEPYQGWKAAVCNFELSQSGTNYDFKAEVTNITIDSQPVPEITMSAAILIKLGTFLSIDIAVGSGLEARGKTNINFDLKITNVTQGATQTIKGYTFKFIPNPVESISLSYPSFVAKDDTQEKFVSIASVSPAEAKVKAKFVSGDPDVLKVDADTGKLEAVKDSSTAIPIYVTATDEEGVTVNSICFVSSKLATPDLYFEFDGQNIDINESSHTFKLFKKGGEDVTGLATYTPGKCEYATDKSIGDINEGILQLSEDVKECGGSSTITATYDGKTATCDVEFGNFGYFNGYYEYWLSKGILSINDDVLLQLEQDVILPSRYFNDITNRWVNLSHIESLKGKSSTKTQKLGKVFVSKNIQAFGDAVFKFDKINNLVVSNKNTSFTSVVDGNECNGVFDKPATKVVAGSTYTTLPASITTLADFSFGGVQFEENEGKYEPKFDISKITSFGKNAFDSSNITDVTINSTIIELKDWIFKDCKKLSNVTIPDNASLTTIGNGVFNGCTNLKTLKIGSTFNLTKIGDNAFDSAGIVELGKDFMGKVNEIGQGAFSNCKELTSIYIPFNITIKRLAFNGCEKLASSRLGGKGFTLEKRDIFWIPVGATGLFALVPNTKDGSEAGNTNFFIDLNAGNTLKPIWHQFKYSYQEDSLWAHEEFNLTTLDIIESWREVWDGGGGTKGWATEKIKAEGFKNKTCLLRANLETKDKYFTTIGNNAFDGCTALATVVIGKSITTIGSNAFANRAALTTVYVKSQTIADKADTCAGLYANATAIYIPKTMTLKDSSYIKVNFPNSVEEGEYIKYTK